MNALYFRFEDSDYTLASMLAANCDDADLCAWLKQARPGDVYRTGGAMGESIVECVA